MPLAFEQQPKESDKAFAAFNLYLSQGPERSLIAAAHKLGKNPRLMYTWSERFDWPARVAAHDAHMALAEPQSAKPVNWAKRYHQLRAANAPSPSAPPSSLPSTINHQPSATWEQQPGEGDKAFSVFSAYLALGPERSLSKAAKATGRTTDQLGHWSQRWHWPARAAAYHAHLAAIERHATEDLVRAKSQDWAKMHESVRREAWAEAEDLIALARHLKARWRNCDRLPALDTILRALELAFKLKQFAAGMPSEITEVNTTVSGADGGPISIEIDAALDRVYGQPLPGEVVDVQELHPPSTINPQPPTK